MSDRLDDIKAHAADYSSVRPDLGDIEWLIAEVERLRRQYDAMRASYVEAEQEIDHLRNPGQGEMVTMQERIDTLTRALQRNDAAVQAVRDLRGESRADPKSWMTGDGRRYMIRAADLDRALDDARGDPGPTDGTAYVITEDESQDEGW